MYELIRLSEHDYYIDCPAKIGLVLNGREAALIDSGSDKDAGKKVLRHIEANGWTLKAIYNTHSHADHIGGNRFLQERTGCRIFAPGVECDFTNHPQLEAACLYGGFPYDALKHKFLLAQESHAEPLTDAVLPEDWQAVPLPGHSFDMTGYKTPDGTLFVADCVSSQETLDKYGLGYLWDVEAYLAALDRVSGLEGARFVPSHAPVVEDIAPLAGANRIAAEEAGARIASLCGEGTGFDELLGRVFEAYGLTMTAQQHELIGSTVRSYLSWLAKTGRVQYRFENNMMLWQSV